jgi:hypothetical protein
VSKPTAHAGRKCTPLCGRYGCHEWTGKRSKTDNSGLTARYLDGWVVDDPSEPPCKHCGRPLAWCCEAGPWARGCLYCNDTLRPTDADLSPNDGH